jgi:hypothetical protein
MSTTRVAPWRTGLPDRPDVPVPPQPMPLLHRRRPLKRWRWVGAFDDDVMLCAAVAHVGPLPVSWWAVWDRSTRTLTERMVRRRGPVRIGERDRLRITDHDVQADLALELGTTVETISPHGDAGHIWTAKSPVHVTGTLSLPGGRTLRLDARGLVDDSAGYHARHTAWRWSAGIGTDDRGAELAWNLVTGLHDAPQASERTVWIDGVPHQLDPVAFDGLDGVGGLRFQAEVTRTHAEHALIASSDYEQPFGTFTGTLPGTGAITGLGVMERHRATW